MNTIYSGEHIGSTRCTGEAHSNANIDGCMSCVNYGPHWGWVPLISWNLEDAIAAGRFYTGPMPDDERIHDIVDMLKCSPIQGQKGRFYIVTVSNLHDALFRAVEAFCTPESQLRPDAARAIVTHTADTIRILAPYTKGQPAILLARTGRRRLHVEGMTGATYPEIARVVYRALATLLQTTY